jgi:hypothetical protein
VDFLTQELAKQAINELGVDNYCLYGIPTNQNEFFEFVKPVKGIDETETVVFYGSCEYPFTFEEFIEKYSEIKNCYNEKEYRRQRAPEYPDIKDQLDAIWKGGGAYEEMLARVMEVKTKYPKPE